MLREEIIERKPRGRLRGLVAVPPAGGADRRGNRRHRGTQSLSGLRSRRPRPVPEGDRRDHQIAYRNYWPLSDRLIHYQLLNNPPLIHASKPGSTYRNDQRSYKALTELLTRARIARNIPFKAIHDPTKPVMRTGRFPLYQARSSAREVDQFLKGYWRDLQAPQPCHLEILGEKNTIASIIQPVAADYTLPFTLGRGYSSLPPRHDMAERFRRTGKERLLLLVLADQDPEGDDIPHSVRPVDGRRLRKSPGSSSSRSRLTADQVGAAAPCRPDRKPRRSSSRRDKFVEDFGEHVYELEAVEPEQLQTILRLND